MVIDGVLLDRPASSVALTWSERVLWPRAITRIC
jgi:hypothetical protein